MSEELDREQEQLLDDDEVRNLRVRPRRRLDRALRQTRLDEKLLVVLHLVFGETRKALIRMRRDS